MNKIDTVGQNDSMSQKESDILQSETLTPLRKVIALALSLVACADNSNTTTSVDMAKNDSGSLCPTGETVRYYNIPPKQLFYCVPTAEFEKCIRRDMISQKYDPADGALSVAPINMLVLRAYDLRKPENQPLPPDYQSAAQVNELYFGSQNSTAEFYRRNSDGNIKITGAVHPKPIGVNSAVYGWQNPCFYEELLTATRSAVPLFDKYNAFSFITDSQGCDGYSQLGPFQDGPNAGIRANFLSQGCVENPGQHNARRFPTHETGHVLGLRHASAYNTGTPPQCESSVPINIGNDINGPIQLCLGNYEDDTLMGRSDVGTMNLGSYVMGDLSASQRRRLGANVPHEVVQSKGTFALSRKTVPSIAQNPPVAEELVIPTIDGSYSLEYNDVKQGIEVRFIPAALPETSNTDTIRVGRNFPVLKEGDLWQDMPRGISITIGKVTPYQVTIQVNSFK